MRTIGIHTRVASLIGAVALLILISPTLAAGQGLDHNSRPVDVTFTKWGAPPPAVPPTPFFGLFEGFSGDGLLGSFNAEILWRQQSVNGHAAGLTAMYEVVDGDRSFTALIQGGSTTAGGLLDGFIVAGWRTGARVQVALERYGAIAGVSSCDGAPVNKTCFVGTIRVERAPRD